MAEQIEVGVGMPYALLLDEFGSQVWSAFGQPPYLVGSALHGKTWRDVDVRLIMSDDDYERWELGDPKHPHQNARWISLVLAYWALGTALTGLPVDFQIQQQTWANITYPGARSAIGTVPLRFVDPPDAKLTASEEVR